MSFQDKYNNIIRRLHTLELDVLVWGPGITRGKDYEKREKIRNTLQSRFLASEVRFSEDPELKEGIPGVENLTLPQQELWHLAACDVCIVLDNSEGAAAEIAHFIHTIDAYKLLILTHLNKKDLQTFPSQLRNNANQIFYTSEEYDSCNLVEQAYNRIMQVALARISRP